MQGQMQPRKATRPAQGGKIGDAYRASPRIGWISMSAGRGSMPNQYPGALGAFLSVGYDGTTQVALTEVTRVPFPGAIA